MKRAAILLLALAACSPPAAPLEAVIKQDATDILLGRRISDVLGVPVPPIALDLPAGFFNPTPVPEGANATQPPRAVCPTADPLSVPEVEARNVINAPPKQASYAFRSDGVITTGGANATATRLPASQTRRITNVGSDGFGGFAYDQIVSNSAGETTTTFRVVGESDVTFPDLPRRAPVTGNEIPAPAGPEPKPPANPGIYLAGVSGTGTRFVAPDAGILLAELPFVPGDQFQTAGSNGEFTMSFTSTVTNRDRVDACGEFVEAWRVDLTNGRFSDSQGRTVATFTASYWFATQFGGIIVKDSSDVSGTAAPSTPVRRTITSTINESP